MRITVAAMDAARDGYSFFTDGAVYEVELGAWQSVLIEWWLAGRDWEWGEA